MTVETFNSNHSTTIISCYSLTNASDETNRFTFYNELSSLVSTIHMHEVLIIDGGMNAELGKDKKDNFYLHNSSKRNGEQLREYSQENRSTCLNTKLQKREGN